MFPNRTVDSSVTQTSHPAVIKAGGGSDCSEQHSAPASMTTARKSFQDHSYLDTVAKAHDLNVAAACELRKLGDGQGQLSAGSHLLCAISEAHNFVAAG
jgi:hypothetical protein